MIARFTAELTPVPHGGHYVAVPERIADAAGLVHGARVRGTVNGAPYRSSVPKYSGVFHLGLPKEALGGATAGDRVTVTVELDPDPRPGDEPPEELARALAASALAQAGYAASAPSHRREHAKHVLEARRPETRARRVAQAIAAFEEKGRATRKR